MNHQSKVGARKRNETEKDLGLADRREWAQPYSSQALKSRATQARRGGRRRGGGGGGGGWLKKCGFGSPGAKGEFDKFSRERRTLKRDRRGLSRGLQLQGKISERRVIPKELTESPFALLRTCPQLASSPSTTPLQKPGNSFLLVYLNPSFNPQPTLHRRGTLHQRSIELAHPTSPLERCSFPSPSSLSSSSLPPSSSPKLKTPISSLPPSPPLSPNDTGMRTETT